MKILILAIIIFSLFTPLLEYIKNKQERINDGNLTLYSDYEYSMGIWIKDNTPKNSIIISDPETIYLMSGISGRQLIISIAMLVQDLQLSDQIKLKLIKDNIFNSLDVDLAYNYSKIIGGYNKVIIVISGRTAQWVSSLSYQFVQQPISFYEIPGFTKFFNTSYFKLLKQYGNNQIYAFELVERPYDYYQHYDLFYINNIEEFDNISIYANSPNEAINQWYLKKIVKSGPVSTVVYNQYHCEAGNPPIIKWNVSISSRYKKISLFIFNLYILNYHPNIFWKFSISGSSWISGNFYDPLQLVFDFITNGEENISWLGHNYNLSTITKLGTFIFVGFY